MHLAKAWTAIDRLSIVWKSDLSDKIKQDFFQAVAVSLLLYGCTVWTLIKRMEKRLDENYAEILQAILNISKKQHPPNSCTVTYHLWNHPSKTNKTCRTLQEKQGQTHKWRSSMDHYTWTCQCWPTSNNLFTSAVCGHRCSLSGMMEDRHGWSERLREINAVSKTWWW